MASKILLPSSSFKGGAGSFLALEPTMQPGRVHCILPIASPAPVLIGATVFFDSGTGSPNSLSMRAISSRGMLSPRSSAIVNPFCRVVTASAFLSRERSELPRSWNTLENCGLRIKVRLKDATASSNCLFSM